MPSKSAIKPILIGVCILVLVGVVFFGYRFIKGRISAPRRSKVEVVAEEATDTVETGFDFLAAMGQIFAPELGEDEASGPIPPKLVGPARVTAQIILIYLGALIVVSVVLKGLGKKGFGAVLRYSLYAVIGWIVYKVLVLVNIDLVGFAKSALAPLTQAKNAAGSVQVIATQNWIDKFGSVIVIILVAGGALLAAQALIKGLARRTTPARREIKRRATQVKGQMTRRNLYFAIGIAVALVLVWAQFAGRDFKNPQTWIPTVSLLAGLLGLFLTLNIYGKETNALAQQALSQLPNLNLVNTGKLIWQGGRLVFLLAIFLGIIWTGTVGSVPFIGLLGSSTIATLTAQILSYPIVLAVVGGTLIIVITYNRVQKST